MKNLVKTRAIISLFLIVLFVVVFISGIGLHLAPSGRIAGEIGWNFLGFDKKQLEMIHTLSGYLMSGLIIIHLLLNYKMLVSEIKILIRRK